MTFEMSFSAQTLGCLLLWVSPPGMVL